MELRVDAEEQLPRVRRICLGLPGAWEKLSHGEPTFFVGKRVFTMFSNNHHQDGHIAVCLPVPEGAQATMLATWPEVFFYPPYVGVSGWVGIELARIGDDDLAAHIAEAWRLRAPAKLLKAPR